MNLGSKFTFQLLAYLFNVVYHQDQKQITVVEKKHTPPAVDMNSTTTTKQICRVSTTRLLFNTLQVRYPDGVPKNLRKETQMTEI
jgi:hypothetical protein